MQTSEECKITKKKKLGRYAYTIVHCNTFHCFCDYCTRLLAGYKVKIRIFIWRHGAGICEGRLLRQEVQNDKACLFASDGQTHSVLSGQQGLCCVTNGKGISSSPPSCQHYDTLPRCLNIYHSWLFVGKCNFLWATRNVKYLLLLKRIQSGLTSVNNADNNSG